MATYLVLNLVFMVIVGLIAGVRARRPSRALMVTCAALLLLTAVFDNVIVGLSIVDYDPAKILGLKIGYAPIEDFMYAIFAVILVPVLWKKVGGASARKN